MSQSKYRAVKKIKSSYILTFCAVLLGAFFVVFFLKFTAGELNMQDIKHDAILNLPTKELYIEIASTVSSRERGLSNKSEIKDNEGMLFIFKVPGRYGFWMKEMKFPIDIIWISEDGHVVNMEENVELSTFPQGFINTASAKYVLEMNGGHAKKSGLYLGTKINIPDKIKQVEAQ